MCSRLLTSRLPDYFLCFCTLALAVERFILVVLPFQAKELLRKRNRLIAYIALTAIILGFIAARVDEFDVNYPWFDVFRRYLSMFEVVRRQHGSKFRRQHGSSFRRQHGSNFRRQHGSKFSTETSTKNSLTAIVKILKFRSMLSSKKHITIHAIVENLKFQSVMS